MFGIAIDCDIDEDKELQTIKRTRKTKQGQSSWSVKYGESCTYSMRSGAPLRVIKVAHLRHMTSMSRNELTAEGEISRT